MFAWLKHFRSRFFKDEGLIPALETIIGFRPQKEAYYLLALRHSSASHKNGKQRLNNQRLEFLGDAVLGSVVADFLYQTYPEATEGFLTNMRSKIVSRKHLNQVGLKLGLNHLVVKKTARGVQAKSIHGDTLEALIGAVYLDLGYEKCLRFIQNRIIENELDLVAIEERITSHKGALLEWGQKNKKEIVFEMTGCYGQSHARQYEISLSIERKFISTGKGSSKKKAEEDAARIAYKKVHQKPANNGD